MPGALQHPILTTRQAETAACRRWYVLGSRATRSWRVLLHSLPSSTLPQQCDIAQEGLQDLGHSPQGLQGFPSVFEKALSTSKGVLK